MRPAQLTPEHFASYPPLARRVATEGLTVLRQLPLSFVPLLLREVIAYDWKFPAERHEVDAQFTYMRSLPPVQLTQLMAAFGELVLSPALEELDWVKSPGIFSERLSAHLWTTDQVAPFRNAAVGFLNAVRAAIPPPPPVVPRLSVVVVGQGVRESAHRLFRKLRPHGTCFSSVNATDGLSILLRRVAARSREHPLPFGHWYIDGGVPAFAPSGVEILAYAELDPVRNAVVAKLRNMTLAGAGTEERGSGLMQLRPEDVGLRGDGPEAVINHFKLAVLSEGSGAQFFSTTFVQWAAREVLRRAQPVTLLARYAPRMTERSMNEALMGTRSAPILDPEGSLVDADMGAHYTWLNQSRLTGSGESSFLAWFENHSEAVLVSPTSERGGQSDEPIDLNGLLDRALRRARRQG